METNHFCTIITLNHLDKTLLLLNSLQQFGPTILHVLIINNNPMLASKIKNLQITENLRIYDQTSLSGPVALMSRLITSKYAGKNDETRWALKPVFIRFLLKEHMPLCYVDCDLYFYNNYQFMIDKLCKKGAATGKSILLTPHFREIYRTKNDQWRYNYKHGIYNAGFIGFGDGCQDMLEWWAEMCTIECTRDIKAWTYVDQKYLDIVPVYFNNVEVLKHYGCNVAGWNTHHLKRSIGPDGKTRVLGKEIVFIHYSQATIQNITNDEDYLLRENFETYRKALQTVRKTLHTAHFTECISSALV